MMLNLSIAISRSGSSPVCLLVYLCLCIFGNFPKVWLMNLPALSGVLVKNQTPGAKCGFGESVCPGTRTKDLIFTKLPRLGHRAGSVVEKAILDLQGCEFQHNVGVEITYK